MSEIVFTEHDFRNILEELISGRTNLVRRVISWNEFKEIAEILVCPSTKVLQTSSSSFLQISIASQVPNNNEMLNSIHNSENDACLILGDQDLNNRIWGVSKVKKFNLKSSDTKKFEAVSKVKIVGGKLPEFQAANKDLGFEPIKKITDRKLLERHSRTIGSLGITVWEKIKNLRFAIVGCGRTGSLIASTLARMGAAKLVFIDSDKVELHNLGEMEGLTEAEIGKNKAKAVANFIQQTCYSKDHKTEIITVDKPVGQTDSEIASCDVIFSCVDNDAARLCCGLIGTSLHKILIDIGTGVLSEPQNSIIARGLDIRLIVPGDGCLRCFGNLVNYDEALSSLVYKQDFLPTQRKLRWWQQRTGSLRYLNQIASGFAVKLLCDFLSQRGFRSTWLQMEFTQSGDYDLYKTIRSENGITPNCPLCRRSGTGI